MTSSAGRTLTPVAGSLLSEVLEGLGRPRKSLPPKLFYDETGSALFDRITELPEYYPTRTEVAIMERHLDEMVAAIGKGSLLVEFGSGSSYKTRLLLDRARALSAYVPVDISCEYLETVAAGLRESYPDLPILPVCADYTHRFELPLPPSPRARIVVYFPGSTVGNFEPDDAGAFMVRIRDFVGAEGGLLIGVDMKKDPSVLHAAYNDAEGVTAAFNLNLLERINRELGGTFDLSQFHHHAAYSPREGRIEMYLVSKAEQEVRVAGRPVAFREGEPILTEHSYKYTVPEFAALARASGFELRRCWTDPNRYFAVLYFEAGRGSWPDTCNNLESPGSRPLAPA